MRALSLKKKKTKHFIVACLKKVRNIIIHITAGASVKTFFHVFAGLLLHFLS